MNLRTVFSVVLLVATIAVPGVAAERIKPTVYTYKTVDDRSLELEVFAQPVDGEAKRPAIVLFHGGGWAQGGTGQFRLHAEYLALRGMVAITPAYRLYGQGETRIIDCIADAKSAMRWVRANADQLGIDPNRIISGGGSAGGHLAACTAVIDEFDDPSDDRTVSARPAALVLFNPVLALTPHDGDDDFNPNWIAKRAGVDLQRISPADHVDDQTPPTIMFFGSEDPFLPGARVFERHMRKHDRRSELLVWEGKRHGFFNAGRDEHRNLIETLEATDRFLVSLGYLEGEPTIRVWPPVNR